MITTTMAAALTDHHVEIPNSKLENNAMMATELMKMVVPANVYNRLSGTVSTLRMKNRHAIQPIHLLFVETKS